ncbi:MAG: DNA-directed RNA polymerase subunit alpha [bacterium]|jgi:DNA-directed RNA polymerase subunit alpha|nr:DNA-directed RNA polymerase subunit alpha [bacterium]MDD3806387.1 DNA-directed RNA polymerase subunit alpha [bacterium]MDD4557924.1 DNA-directed RNA polymerase subunit alpha [bacterium]
MAEIMAKIECLVSDERYMKLVIEPLERGFGNTIGNALRRTLMSSLPGAAITAVKIEGVLHEFSTLPGVAEDVTEIVLNMKELAVKLSGDEPRSMRIEAEGIGEVKASDIIVPAEVEICNPDLHIAELTEKNARLFMDIIVERGAGYVPAEKHRRFGHQVGIIPIDSIFTPVQRMNYIVEDTRVGQVTDYDKLILEVWTNGCLKPEEAMGFAARLLHDHLKLFFDFSGVTFEGTEAKEVETESKKIKELTLEELGLSVRPYNCLKRAGINTVEELLTKTDSEITGVRNFGKKSLEEIKEKLAEHGLTLKESAE